MKVYVFLFLVGLPLVHSASRPKRAAYDLPAGAALLVGFIRTTFECNNDGYYADEDNFCEIFHVCHSVVSPDGSSEMMHWSFLCGNQTVFNQFSLTCSSREDAIPCERVKDFWHLNSNLRAGPNVPFHSVQDAERAAAVTPGRPPYPPPQSQFSLSTPSTTLGPQSGAGPARPSPPTNFPG